jgi:hypothetical protein
MSRKSSLSISLKPNVRCLRVYPTEETQKTVPELKTVGIKLSKEQAVDLARLLLAATQEWQEIDVTAYRFSKRESDGTYHITVTSFCTKD